VHTLESPAQMARFGVRVGELLSGGELLALDGPLGAGKTAFVGGLARGLGVDAGEPVISPTFVLLREYAGRLRLYHMDLYRLQSLDDLETLGFDELCADRGGVLAIEWAARIPDVVDRATYRLTFEHADEQSRRVTVFHAR
jgi:tRNA threonylcarbamoyladenosine biosynthesis protein TsaE